MHGPTVPVTNTTRGAESVRASLILTATYVSGTIIPCDGMRTARLWLAQDGASAANELSVLTLLSPGDGTDTAPLAGADAWYAPGEFDGTYTDEALTGTLAAGSDFTAAPPWRSAVVAPLRIKLKPHTNTTDKVRICWPVNITGARWVQFQFADIDAGGTLSTLAATVTFSA